MSRPGVNYETVKQSAIKLLSQGTAPSVQKIRDTLGTGSNTTIAEHLKVWREEHKTKEIHHLPSNMPKELVSAIEVLWQTAMEQANNQLSEVKKHLNVQQVQLKQDKLIYETKIKDLNNTLEINQQAFDYKNKEAQDLSTELTITQEKLSNTTNVLSETIKKHGLHINQLTNEKQIVNQETNSLHKDIKTLQQQLINQSEQHQSTLQDARLQQEQSENRWLNLIDQARQDAKQARQESKQVKQDAKDIRKDLESNIDKKYHQIIKMQNSITDYKYTMNTQITELKQNKVTINDLNSQINKGNKNKAATKELIGYYKYLINTLITNI